MDITARLTAAVHVLLEDTDKAKTLDAAQRIYFADPTNEANRDDFISALDERAAIVDPIKNILIEAWTSAISKASKKNLLKPLDQGGAATIFENVWTPLLAEGWDALPEYRHEQFAEALAATTRQIALGDKPTGTPFELAVDMLDDIAAGTIPYGYGAGDFFTNFADGSGLHIQMDAWAPVLSAKGKKPTPTSDGKIFTTQFDVLSGRVLVADSVRVGPIPDLMLKLRKEHNLSVNYDWHRALRTTLCAHHLNIIDVAMGDDGPGLVTSAEMDRTDDTIFSGFDNEDWPEIASVCHDYWGTTMIDRAYVIAAMKATEGDTFDPDLANAEIDGWLADSAFHTEIEMKPGIWHFTWDDDRKSLDAALRSADISAPPDTRFVLTRAPLDLGNAKIIDMGALLRNHDPDI